MLPTCIVIRVGVHRLLVHTGGMIPNDLVELPHVRPSIALREYPIFRDVEWLDPQVQQPMAPLAPSHEEIAHIHAPSR